MTNDAIKPCPFCGGDADIDEFEGKLLETVFAASCNNDDCPIGHKDHGSWPTKTDALNSWNTRAALAQAPKADVEALDAFNWLKSMGMISFNDTGFNKGVSAIVYGEQLKLVEDFLNGKK